MIAANMRAVALIATSLGVLAGTAVTAAAATQVTPAAAAPCAPSDVSLRQVTNAAPPSPDVETVYALQNGGATPCRVSGGVNIRLFDAQGKLIELRFAARNRMAMLLTLAPGDEATFSISFAPHAPMESVTTARIEVYVAAQLVPVSAPTTIAAFSGPAVRVSNLRLVPSTPSRLMLP